MTDQRQNREPLQDALEGLEEGLQEKHLPFGIKANNEKERLLFLGAGSLLFLLLLLGSWGMGRRERTAWPIVCLGDSVLAMTRDETSITHLMEEQLGVEVFNGAMGGTNMSRTNFSRDMGYSKDSLTMAALAQAIGYRDFGAQQAAQVRENGTEYFEQTIDDLEKIDFNNVEILLIEHGINDYNSGIPIYSDHNPYDLYTFTGALRYSITLLQEKYPKLRIILVTPTYSWYRKAHMTCEQWNSGYGYLEDYVEAEIRLAKELGIEVIDNYHDFYPHERWEDWELYTVDGIHPNEDGRRLIAQRLAEYLLDERESFEPQR